MIIIMLGAPGTGKGTAAKVLTKGLNIPAVWSGDIFRKAIADGTELGKEVEGYISNGKLVPDELTIKVIEARLKEPDLANGVILDGFPRTTEQAERLDKFLSQEGKKIDLVVNLETPVEELIERVVNRRKCPNCKADFNMKLNPPKTGEICDFCGTPLERRADDNEETMRARLDTYEKQTAPIVDFYQKQGNLLTAEVSKRCGRMAPELAESIIEDFRKKGLV